MGNRENVVYKLKSGEAVLFNTINDVLTYKCVLISDYKIVCYKFKKDMSKIKFLKKNSQIFFLNEYNDLVGNYDIHLNDVYLLLKYYLNNNILLFNKGHDISISIYKHLFEKYYNLKNINVVYTLSKYIFDMQLNGL